MRSGRLTPFLFFCLHLVFFSAFGSAEEKRVFSLHESISVALAENWSLKAVEEKVDQAINQKNQAGADFLLKLSTSYGYTRLSEEPTMRIGGMSTSTGPGGMPSLSFNDLPIGTQNNYKWKGTVTQPLFMGFALVSSYDFAKLGLDKSKMEFELKKLDLALRAKEAYFNILIADNTVVVAEKDVESRESNVNVARSFYKVGMIPVNDLLKAEVELGNSHQNLVTARNASILARADFNIVLSRPVNASCRSRGHPGI